MKALFRIILVLSLCVVAEAAIDAAVVWNVQTDGSQTNGGGFKTGATGTDYSQQASAQWALVNMSAGGASATITDANAAATMVGNIIYVSGGTNATTGWYEITSVNAGVDITVDRNWCTGACANGTGNIGGAFLLGGSLDDDFFENTTAGNEIFVKSGTYTIGEIIDVGKDGTNAAPLKLNGYQTTHDDYPTEDDRPLLDFGSNKYFNFQSGNYWMLANLRLTGSANFTLLNMAGTGQHLFNVKATHTSTTDAEIAINLGSNTAVSCEAISYLDNAFSVLTGRLIGCYAHDSETGISCSGSQQPSIVDCQIDNCYYGINFAGMLDFLVSGCLIRGCYMGIEGGTGNHGTAVNNIIADNYIGVRFASALPSHYFDWNVYSNNDTDTTNLTKGDNSITGDASLAGGVAEGSDGATDGAGTAFTAASNPFSGVTTSDFLTIVETGTGATVGTYNIVTVVGGGEVTLGRSAGASKTGIDYKVVKGNDSTPSSNSNAKNAGTGPPSHGGAGGNNPHIGSGATPDESAAGGGINKAGNKQ